MVYLGSANWIWKPKVATLSSEHVGVPTFLVNHHLTEEELTILNPAREEVGERVRADLGEQFATERNRQIDGGCGSLTNVRRIVAAARKEGLLDDDGKDE